MYDPGPSDEELKAVGLEREDVEDTSILEVWPENWLPKEVFSETGSQWRVGAAGPTGLDYNVLYKNLDLRRLKRKTYQDVFQAVRILEAAALKQMTKK